MNQLRTRAYAPGALLLSWLLLTGCAAARTQAPVTGHPHQPVTGQLAGRMVMAGGPLGPGGQQPGERPVPGTVTITAAGHQRARIRVGSSGAFSAWLPPGTYQLSGCTPAIEGTGPGGNWEPACSQPTSATVTAQHTATVTITFSVP